MAGSSILKDTPDCTRVKVRIFYIWVPDAEARRAADAQSGPYEFPFAKSTGVEGELFLPGGVVSDADGRFRIEGLGRDVMTLLEVVGPKVAYKRFRVISRQAPIASERHESGSDRLVLPTTNSGTLSRSPSSRHGQLKASSGTSKPNSRFRERS